MSYWDSTVERIFNLDKRIRSVVITDMNYHTVISRMRKGFESLTPLAAESTVSIVPRIMVEGAQRLEPYLGSVETVSARYKKAMLVFYRAREYIIMLTFEPSVETPFHTRLASDLARILY